MSKDISTVALVGAVLLTTQLWKRIKEYVQLSNSVFQNDLKTNNKVTKKAVETAINNMDEKKRGELFTELNKENQNFEVRDKVVKILKDSKIARGSNQGKQPEKKEEAPPKPPTPALASQMADRKREEEAERKREEEEEEEKIYQSYVAEIEAEAREIERIQEEQEQEVDRMTSVLEAIAERKEEKDSLEALSRIRQRRLALTMPSGLNVFEGIPTGEQKEKARKELRKEATSSAKNILSFIKKKATREIKKREDLMKPKVPTLARRTADALERMETGQQDLVTGQQRLEIGLQEIKNTMKRIQETPELQTIESKIRNRLPQDGTTEFKGVGLDAQSLNQITSTIPQEYRGLLGPAVRGLVGENLKLNEVISGLVGLAVSVGSGSSVIGLGTKSIIDNVFKSFNINMNDILTIPEAPAVSAVPAVSVITPSAPPADQDAVITPSAPPAEEQRFNQLLRLAQTATTGARKATPDEVRRGALVGGATGALVGGLSSGSLMTGAGSMIAGGLIGAPVSSLVSGQMQRVSELIESKFKNITPERKEQIRMIVQALPPALIAAVMSFNPEDVEPMGTGIITGAGVTERKLTVSPDLIARTKAQETQAQGSNKIWQPKSISPTTDILNETKQEKYADDLEFIAFNYIAPTSQGAQGTIDTNPLKRSQATADAIRYTDAGVTIPYLLWNQINDASTLTPNRLQKMALGVELPPMEFMEQDNETTFENVATVQYPNNEPMAIEFLSPYADFSNVDNFWAMNPDNMLFTINA